MNLDSVLYFSSINFNGHQNQFWQDVYNSTSEGGRFAIDMARRLNPNRFVSRDKSIWTNPWPQEVIPKYAMLTPVPCSLSFAEVSDLTANKIAQRINAGEKFAVMYSGGIDSTVILIALLKNLTPEQLQSVSVCTSTAAIVENPMLWKNYIYGKLNTIDSMTHKYDDLIKSGYTPITADDGDCIFGTVFGLNVYHSWQSIATAESRQYIGSIIDKFSDPEVHYTKFADLLVQYFNIPPNQQFPIVGQANPDPKFGRRLYEKFHLNCQTASVPINSLHDFFWWLIFNVKMLNCGVRGAIYYNDTIDMNTVIHKIENWYMDANYQQWSMSNNNNGQKILNSAATYKKAARDYIYDFDRNDWYRSFKLKLESMALNVARQQVSGHLPNGVPGNRFGLTKDYELLQINDKTVQEYIKTHLNSFQIDWAE